METEFDLRIIGSREGEGGILGVRCEGDGGDDVLIASICLASAILHCANDTSAPKDFVKGVFRTVRIIMKHPEVLASSEEEAGGNVPA